ncbi:hypothetical protein N9850_11010, partial [Granulosicoccus sp.]
KPKSFDGLISATAFQTVSKLRLSIDKYALEQEFRSWLGAQRITPKSPDAMFIKYAQTRKRKEGSLF